MKKHFSSLIVLTLFLNNFSVFAMQKYEEQGDSLLEKLPEEIITWKILPLLDIESIRNMRNTNRFLREGVNKFLCFTQEKDLKNGIFKGLFDSHLQHEEIKHLITKLESEIRKDKNLFLYKNKNKLKIKDLTNKDIKKELFKIFKAYDPKIIEVFDEIVKIFKKLYTTQEFITFKTLKITYNTIEDLLFKAFKKISEITNNKIIIDSLSSSSCDDLIQFLSFTLTASLLISSIAILLPKTVAGIFFGLSMHNFIIWLDIPSVRDSYYNRYLCLTSTISHSILDRAIHKKRRTVFAIPFICMKTYSCLYDELNQTGSNIVEDLRNILRDYICYKKKLRQAIYGEQELHEKKNQ